jgi:type IV pilus assembly protein PilA
LSTTGTTALTCTTKGGNATKFNGQTITWNRDSTTGAWTCASSLDAKFKPGTCS